MKIDRLLTITVMLLNRKKVTAAQLAEYFEVSQRTIYRDFETLNNAGIPIVSHQGFEGGYCIPDNFKMSRQLLTYEDMVSIITTLQGVNRTFNNRDITRVIEKISSLIPHDKQDHYKQQKDSFVIDISPWGGHFRKENLELIHKAVSESRLLRIRYYAASGKITDRSVEPHTLVFKSFNWYMLAYCRRRDDFRVFRLSRIENGEILPHHFMRKEVEPHLFFDHHHNSRPTINLLLQFNSESKIRAEEMFGAEQVKVLDTGKVQVLLTVPDDEWIASLVLSFGEIVEILEPPRWRQKIQERIQKMQSIYMDLE